ncbi:MAG: O-antigen ligase family protein [Sediminibacterium sp.]
MIGGLPFYATSLSTFFLIGGKNIIPFVQATKELVVVLCLGTLILQNKILFKWTLLDRLILIFFIGSSIYVFLPIGPNGFLQRLLAFKGLSFFPLVYFCGRLFPLRKTHLEKYFIFILVLTIAAAALSLGEYLLQTHLQAYTGYSDLNYYVYKQDPSGNYGLTWTFEIQNGAKRFASFFSTPLEHAAATIIALAIIAGLYTEKSNQLFLSKFGWIALVATVASILLSLSRAAVLSYFAVILIYSFITKRREILSIFYLTIVLFVVYLFSFSSKDIQDFVMDTITFSNESSVGHLAEWLIGLESMIAKPLGLGIGASGGITANEGNAVGGENQFIIVGVQIGIAGLLLYAWIHFYTIYLAYKNYKILKGKEQKIAMTVLLIRVGMFLPMFTSNLDTFIYISYLMWFMTGLLSNILSKPYAHLEHKTV